jgi:LPPG:FO 2-phospho-L-lactate transferase
VSKKGPGRVTVLAGGVGAARFLRGVAPLLRPRDLTVVVNTGDDDSFYGLEVSPDIDTILYTLAGLSDPIRGWGLSGDSFRSLEALRRFFPETWFQLGDQDLATHLHRTARLRRGDRLSAITAAQAAAFGVRANVLPMSDDPVRTIVETSGGRRSFQEYLVRDRARESVRSLSYSKARAAKPAPGVRAAIEDADAILIAPSNPLVSIAPILAVPGIRQSLRRTGARVVAVSPLIGGRPVKGPADRMMRALGMSPTPLAIAEYYADFLDGMVIDSVDREHARRLEARGVAVACLDTLMSSPVRAIAVARAALELARPRERRRTLAS